MVLFDSLACAAVFGQSVGEIGIIREALFESMQFITLHPPFGVCFQRFDIVQVIPHARWTWVWQPW